jgi:hypothetical protein
MVRFASRPQRRPMVNSFGFFGGIIGKKLSTVSGSKTNLSLARHQTGSV